MYTYSTQRNLDTLRKSSPMKRPPRHQPVLCLHTPHRPTLYGEGWRIAKTEMARCGRCFCGVRRAERISREFDAEHSEYIVVCLSAQVHPTTPQLNRKPLCIRHRSLAGVSLLSHVRCQQLPVFTTGLQMLVRCCAAFGQRVQAASV